MDFPEQLRYTKDHEWIRIQGEEGIIGITNFAQGELGDVVFVEMNCIGQTLAKEAIFGTVEAVKTVSDLFMPVSGEVVEINQKIAEHPELVNKDPYGEGWMIRVHISAPEECNELMSSEEYRKMIG